MRDSNLNYVIDIWGKLWEFECMGCSIVNHELDVPGGFIYEDDKFTIQQDPVVPVNGFIVVNVKKHINSITLLNEEERNKLMELTNKVITYLKELNITQEVTIVQEERSEHLHIWIFPHHAWMDEKFNRGVSNLREIFNYAKENATEVDKKAIIDTVYKLKNKFKYS